MAVVTVFAAAPAPGHAALQARSLDGANATVEAYYDTLLDITWLADFRSQQALLSWSGAMSWAAQLQAGGVTGWRLPTVSPVSGGSFLLTGTNNGSTDAGTAAAGIGWGTRSELGHLYYVTFGLTGKCQPNNAAPSSCVTPAAYDSTPDLSPLKHVGLNMGYWTGTLVNNNNSALAFLFSEGRQGTGSLGIQAYAVAVHAGDVGVAPVPEPATAASLLGGLALLGAVMRRRRSA
ncbi:PEP-CTERM sorting domain-containing protein [Ideonella sp. DXS22W]|uniref:PEP-CTERM sorting domain-containing protein n=1 Tax=Pseudaquabacterium inlustre TaxID=2984192 RepID=A0ABU9CCC4_9BURK